MKELHRPDELHSLLPQADFVIMTVPQTPQTRGMMAAREFRLMKKTAYLINIGRGGCVVLDDLVEALRAGEIRAGLDVFQIEPLPPEHPLWTMPGVLITPHVAGVGPYLPAPHRATAGRIAVGSAQDSRYSTLSIKPIGSERALTFLLPGVLLVSGRARMSHLSLLPPGDGRAGPLSPLSGRGLGEGDRASV